MGTVYVYGIHPWIPQRKLLSTFGTFGQIEDVSIMKSNRDASSKMGIVFFKHREDALESVRCLNGARTEVGGPLSVEIVGNFAQGYPSTVAQGSFAGSPSCVLESVPRMNSADIDKTTDSNNLVFVKNFKDLLDESKLRALFEVCGRVKSVSIKRENGKSKGYGFVEFEDHSSAEEAVNVLNGEEIEGKRKIEVAFVQRKEERKKMLSDLHKGVEKQNIEGNSVLYIKNLPKDTTNESLTKLFEEFGTVASVSIKTKENAPTVVGFVSFTSPADAVRAQMHMHGYVIESRKLEVFVKNDGNQRRVNRVSVPTSRSPTEYAQNAICSNMLAFHARNLKA